MTFHWPQLFWLLALPVVLVLVELRRRSISVLGSEHPKIARAEAGRSDLQLVQTQESVDGGARPRGRVRWRMHLGIALLITALARPQWGQLDEPVFDQAREIIIAVDLSRSMLATDVRPSRLDRSKLLVTSLLERLAGERVGLIVFAGTAFLQSPLSSDYEILNEFLPSLTPDYLPQGGSNYEALISTAVDAFSSSGSADRFLIILSDGEATDDRWKEGAKELQEKGIRVLGLGVGTPAGSILPDSKGGYIKDERGAVVLSKLEPTTLQELASMTNGAYLDASSWVDLSQLIESTVETGKKGEFREQRHARFVERFQWWLAPALFFFLWSFYRDFPVQPRPRDVKLKTALPPPLPQSKATSTTAAVTLLLSGFLAASPQTVDAAETTSAAEPLSQLVGQYAARETLTGRDYAALAQATVTYGQRMKGSQQAPAEGAIRDGLSAVQAGEVLDRKAADWPTLRQQLEELLPKEDQKQEPAPQNDEKQDQKDQQDQQQKQSKDDQSKQDSKQENQKSDQNQKSEKQQAPENQQKQEPESSEQKDSSDEKSPEQKQPPSQPQSAFGDMNEKQDPPPSEKAPPPPSPETQRVERKEKNDPNQNTDPALVVPLQRLQQVRNQDDPVRLQKIMRGEKDTPADRGKDW